MVIRKLSFIAHNFYEILKHFEKVEKNHIKIIENFQDKPEVSKSAKESYMEFTEDDSEDEFFDLEDNFDREPDYSESQREAQEFVEKQAKKQAEEQKKEDQS